MQIKSFIQNCLKAITSEISLNTIFSLNSKINRRIIQRENDRSQDYQINIYRAQGGKIRIEKCYQEQKIITIINGLIAIEKVEVLGEKSSSLVKLMSLDSSEIITIKRAVRLYPRNFLAHINEYQYDFRGLEIFDNNSLYRLDFLQEEVTYYFDSSTFLCLSLIDKKNNSKTYYSNYKKINDILTPLEEKTISEAQIQIDTIEKIDYNLKLEDNLFKVD